MEILTPTPIFDRTPRQVVSPAFSRAPWGIASVGRAGFIVNEPGDGSHWSKQQSPNRTSAKAAATVAASTSHHVPSQTFSLSPSSSSKALKSLSMTNRAIQQPVMELALSGAGIKGPARCRAQDPSAASAVASSSALHASQSLINFPITDSSPTSSSAPSSTACTAVSSSRKPSSPKCDTSRLRSRSRSRTAIRSQLMQVFDGDADTRAQTQTKASSSRSRSRSLARSRSLDETALETLTLRSKSRSASPETPYHSCRSTPSPSFDQFPPPQSLSPLRLPKSLLSRKTSRPKHEPAPTKATAESLERTWHTLSEIVETEKGYLDDLRTLVSVYEESLFQTFEMSTEEARVVSRNSRAVLQFHEKLQVQLRPVEQVISSSCVSARTAQSELARIERALTKAVDWLARIFLVNARGFDIYQEYCAGHTEALDIIRRLQTSRPIDWDAFEKRSSRSSSPPPTSNRPSALGARRRHNTVDTPRLRIVTSIRVPDEQEMGHGGWEGGVGSVTSKLSFMDFLIKPIQRICKYPLLLAQLKDAMSRTGLRAGAGHTSDTASAGMLDLALGDMKSVVSGVDEARKVREGQVKTRLIAQRIESHMVLTQAVIVSLGDCILAGSLHVIYHHDLLAPFRPPVRARYLGAFLYSGYLVLVKVKRGKTYEPRHWFPTRNAEVVDTSPRKSGSPGVAGLMPYSFRLAIGMHHFELAATSVGEKDLWLRSMKEGIAAALPLSRELEAITSLKGTLEPNARNQPFGLEDMVKFLTEPPSTAPRPDSMYDGQDSLPLESPNMHVRSASAVVGETIACWSSTAPFGAAPRRRASIFGASDRTSPVSPAATSASLVRQDSSAQHAIVDKNLSDVFSMACLALRAPILGTSTISSSHANYDKPLVSPTSFGLSGRTKSLSRATTKVLSRNSSVGSIFYRKSTAGIHSGNEEHRRATVSTIMPPPPIPALPQSTRSSPSRRRTFLNSLSLLAPSAGTEPSIVFEAEKEGSSGSRINLGTPDTVEFGKKVLPTAIDYHSPPPLSPDTASSESRHQSLRRSRSRRESMGQSLLEFFSRHSSSSSSVQKRSTSMAPAASSNRFSSPPTSFTPTYPSSTETSAGSELSSAKEASPPSFVQRSVAYVQRKRALSVSGLPIELLSSVGSADARANLMTANASGSPTSSNLGDDAEVARSAAAANSSRNSLHTKSSIVSLRAMLALEPRKSRKTVEGQSTRPDRQRAKSAPLEEQPLLAGAENRKISHKPSKNFKRTLFQV